MKKSITKISVLLLSSVMLSGCLGTPNRVAWSEPDPTSVEPGTSADPGTSSTIVDPTSSTGTPTSPTSDSHVEPVQQFTVRFINGESVIKSLIVDGGSSVSSASVPTNVTKSGYEFVGWSTNPLGDPLVTPISYVVNQNTDFYAVFRVVETFYTAYFYVDGNSVGNYQVKEGGHLSASNIPDDPSKSGYNFVGWSLKENEKDIVDPPTYTINHNTSFYAWFEAIQTNYTVRFINDGTTVKSFSVVANGYVSSSQLPTDPSKSGYTFAGWSTSETTKSIKDVTTYKIVANTDFYAWFDKNVTYFTVAFYNESAVVKSLNIEEGSYLTSSQVPSNPSKSGYTFVGWSIGSSNQNVVNPLNQQINSNISFYAYYTKNAQTYTVTFVADGVTKATLSIQEGNKVSSSQIPTNITKVGHTFVGWSDQGPSGITVDPTSITINANKTFYAVFEINNYNVRFYKDSSVVKTVSVAYNNKVSSSDIPTVSKDGYNFVGWSATQGSSATVTVTSISITSDKNFYAVFSEIVQTYTVTFYNGSSVHATFNVNEGSKLSSLPSNPSKSGYTFKGWAETSGGATVNPLTYTINANKSFYAVFEEQSSGGDTGYYASCAGLKGTALATEIRSFNTAKNKSYCWEYDEIADEALDDSNSVLCIYTRHNIGKSNHVSSGYSWDKWNREHIWTQSAYPNSASDANNYFACEGQINNYRSSFIFDEGGSIVTVHGHTTECKLKSGTSFEPCDAAKGEVARSVMYGTVMYNYTMTNEIKSIYLCLKWHYDHPVTERDIQRNERIYSQVHQNRNPFVDHPEYACRIWGSTNSQTQSLCTSLGYEY